MKQSKIILLLFSLSVTTCIYVVFSSPTPNSQIIHPPVALNNYVEADTQNKTISDIYFSDNQLTTSTTHTSVDKSDNTIAMNNPHLPVAYKIEPHETDPESVEDDSNKAKSPYLEEGQSRTLLYASTGFNNTNPEGNENFDDNESSNTNYFLQPGQSRTFFAKPEQNDYIPDEEESPLH